MPGLDPGIHAPVPTDFRQEAGIDGRDEPGHDDREMLRSRDWAQPAIPVSAVTGAGLASLLSALGSRIAVAYRSEAPLLTRARHRQALEDAAASLHRALAAPLPELRAEDLRLALRSLGHITGTIGVEDLLDIIFRDFCLGK